MLDVFFFVFAVYNYTGNKKRLDFGPIKVKYIPFDNTKPQVCCTKHHDYLTVMLFFLTLWGPTFFFKIKTIFTQKYGSSYRF